MVKKEITWDDNISSKRGYVNVYEGYFNRNNNSYPVSFMVQKYPMQNCQMFSIAHMEHFLIEGYNTLEEIKDLIKQCAIKVNQKICLCDVHTSYAETLKSIFGSSVMNVTKYESTNGSSMALVMINTTMF